MLTKVNYQFNLPVSIIREGDSFIAYTPALDIFTVGDSFEEAQKRFNEAVEIFFEEITANDTVDEALTELGWQKHNNELIPPIVVSNMTQKFSIPCI
jgi:hypothetical protein